jgi:hypothetical protein
VSTSNILRLAARAARVGALGVALAAAGCAQHAPLVVPAQRARTAPRLPVLDKALEERILALDPERIGEHDVRSTLALGPTPRIILVHGTVYPAQLVMSSFAEFLERMGYPGSRLRDPADGAYSQSPYDSSERLAGAIAWYYERDGVRPMIVGHSQGGMQAIKVLYQLAGDFSPSVDVWNPLTGQAERRSTIVDPLSGAERAVVGLSVAYAAAVAAGGAAFMLPNQWDMVFRLRRIPDSVDEFTGYSVQGDMVAWTFPGTSAVSDYHRGGSTNVRNVVLPLTYNHLMVPVTHALANDAKTRDWINAYVPPRDGERPAIPDGVMAYNVLWAADVWFGIKKHWCIEAQRLIRARRAMPDTASARDPPRPM